MHELGHTLGLEHGGHDATEFKPNHFSVMNYHFQTTGVLTAAGDRVFDYAPAVAVPTLNEAELIERDGLKAPPSLPFITLRFCPGATTRTSARRTPLNVPVNWDCDRQIDAGKVRASVNRDADLEVLQAVGEWQLVRFQGGQVGAPGATPPEQTASRPPEPAASQLQALARALLGDQRRPSVRAHVQVRGGRHILRATARDDSGLDRLVAYAGGRRRATAARREGRRRLELTWRLPTGSKRVRLIALDRAARHSPVKRLRLPS
jgi:hypothetical protein